MYTLTLRYVLLIILITVPTILIAGYDFLLQKTTAQRYIELDSIFVSIYKSDSVTYFKVADQLAQFADNVDDEEMRLDVSYYRGLYYMHGSQSNPYLILPYFTNLLEHKKNRRLLSRCYLVVAKYYQDYENMIAPATYHYLKSYNQLKDVALSECPDKKEILSSIGTSLYKLHDLENAKRILLHAEKTPMSDDYLTKRYVFADIKNTLGLLQMGTAKNYDSAIYYFRQTHDLAVKYNLANWVSIAEGNIGRCYARKGDYKKALEISDKGLPDIIDSNDIDGLFAYLANIADHRLKLKDYNGAKPYLFMANSIVKLTGDVYYNMFCQYRLLATYYAGIGDISHAYIYSREALAANDSLKNWSTIMQMARSREKIEKELFETELEGVETERKIQMLWRNALIAVIFLSSIIAILFINRRSLKHRQKRKLAEAEKEKTAGELKAAEIQLQDFVERIHEKNALIESFTTEIEKYQSLPCSNELPVNNDILIQLQQSVLLTDEQWEVFKLNFEKVHGGFLNRLKEKMPDLTPAETRFMVLSKLNLSNKEMAAMLGVSAQGVRNYKYRLLKKLELSAESSVEELLKIIE